MQPIAVCLWYDSEAVEAADFYVSLFPDSDIRSKVVIRNTPSGDCDLVDFDLAGQRFMAISAGPHFKINPSVSFMVNFDPSRDPEAENHLDEMWSALSEGGTALMPLGEYPFSKRFGWVQDRYGPSWQLILSDPEGEPRPFIVPSLLFVGNVCGKADEAIDFYCSVFEDSRRGVVERYGPGQEPEQEGNVMFADFRLGDVWLAAMDSSHPHDFGFNEAVSLLVPCENQHEIDYFSDRLSAVPEAEECGWIKDKYGLSWQIWPAVVGELMAEGSPDQIDRLTAATLTMKRYDIRALLAAYEAG